MFGNLRKAAPLFRALPSMINSMARLSLSALALSSHDCLERPSFGQRSSPSEGGAEDEEREAAGEERLQLVPAPAAAAAYERRPAGARHHLRVP